MCASRRELDTPYETSGTPPCVTASRSSTVPRHEIAFRGQRGRFERAARSRGTAARRPRTAERTSLRLTCPRQ